MASYYLPHAFNQHYYRLKASVCHQLTGRKLIHSATAFGIDSILSDNFDFFIVFFSFLSTDKGNVVMFLFAYKPVFILDSDLMISYQDRLVFIGCMEAKQL